MNDEQETHEDSMASDGRLIAHPYSFNVEGY
jgi:hypothetical protein